MVSLGQDDYINDIRPDNNSVPLSDSVSSIEWAPLSMGNIFACVCWDGTLQVYEMVNTGYTFALSQKINVKAKSPLTKCVWSQDGQTIYLGDITGTIQSFSLQTQQFADIGKQNAAISALHVIPGQNIVISAAFQNTINFWQPGNSQPVFTVDLGNKVYCTDFSLPILIAALGNQMIAIIDVTNPGNKTILDSKDLGKNSIIQSCAINNKQDTIGLSTFDGRSNISKLKKNPTSGQFTTESIITFKSHKYQTNPSQIVLYPVNASSFSPASPIWFMTCGSDGYMNFWDVSVRNKIKFLAFATSPICSAKVSQTGQFIAYGLGNDFHIGLQGNKWQPKIAVHKLTQQQMKFQGPVLK